jgi:tRNA A-37 threonylcarbamoyl transferase component Bud32
MNTFILLGLVMGASFAKGSVPECNEAEFQKVNVLGEGAEGQVWLVTKDNTPFALKQCFRNCKNEIDMLETVKGKGITTDIQCKFPNNEGFVMDYVKGTSIVMLVLDRQVPVLQDKSGDVFRSILRRMVQTMQKLHSLGIRHNDCHIGNWLLGGDHGETLMLVDFGFAKGGLPGGEPKDATAKEDVQLLHEDLEYFYSCFKAYQQNSDTVPSELEHFLGRMPELSFAEMLAEPYLAHA